MSQREYDQLLDERNQLLKEKDRAIWGTVADGNQDARNRLVLLGQALDDAVAVVRDLLIELRPEITKAEDFLERVGGGARRLRQGK